jgi:ArsR family transcriptional regulator
MGCRYRYEGEAGGLHDRSSAPRRVASRTPTDRVATIVALRQLRMTAAEIDEQACGHLPMRMVRCLEDNRSIEVRRKPVVELATMFRALSDPNRLAIYRLIRERDRASVEELERSISALAREFELSLSTVSHHIKELRQAGLIRCAKRGQTVYCEPDPAAVDAIERFLREDGS